MSRLNYILVIFFCGRLGYGDLVVVAKKLAEKMSSSEDLVRTVP